MHHNIERNFNITGLTQRHGPSILSKTFETLASYFKIHGPYKHRTGHKSAYAIPDMIDCGLNIIEISTSTPDEVDHQVLEVELL